MGIYTYIYMGIYTYIGIGFEVVDGGAGARI